MFKIITCIFLLLLNANALEKLKIGVLAYGTVNWELEVLKENKLDIKNGFELEFVKLASKNAQNIALQSNSVDIIVNDFFWVNIQRENGKDFTFYPYSKATGTIFVPNEFKGDLADLKGKTIGISGNAYDKTWLILQAYSKKKYNTNLKDIVNPIYASAPILYQKMLDGSFDASVNYWHFNSKLQTKGFKPLITMKEILNELNIKDDLSFVGWTFSRQKALENKKLYNSFIKATFQAKDILLSDDKQWESIKPLMKSEDDMIFSSLKKGYREGVVKEFGKDNLEASYKIFDLLLKEGGENLLENSKVLQKETFWNYEEN